MGNFFSQRVRGDDHEGDNRSAVCSTVPTPITDSLSNEVRGLLNQIEVPYEKCLNALREKELQLNSQEDELERHKKEYHREKEQLEQEKKRLQQLEALQSENLQLKKELTELKKLTSAAYTSRKRHGDVRPGDITHENLLEMYQKYYDTKYRHLLTEQNFKSRESRCDFLSSVLKVACKQTCEHVTQAVTQELQALHRPPSSVNGDDSNQMEEKWMDRSGAFGLLLSAAGIESNPEQCPPSLKEQILLELQNKNGSFRNAHEAKPQEMDNVLESAVNIAWVMSTLVPPASFHQPEEFHDEWHEIVAPTSEDEDPECDYELVYCRPVLFFGAEGTVGKVGAVKRKKVAWADHSSCNPLLQSAHPCQEQQTALIEVPMQCLQSNSLDKDEQDLRNGEDDQPPDEDAEIKSKAS